MFSTRLGGVPAHAGGAAAGFLQILPSSVPPRCADAEHTHRTRRVLGTCRALSRAPLTFAPSLIELQKTFFFLKMWCVCARSSGGRDGGLLKGSVCVCVPSRWLTRAGVYMSMCDLPVCVGVSITAGCRWCSLLLFEVGAAAAVAAGCLAFWFCDSGAGKKEKKKNTHIELCMWTQIWLSHPAAFVSD